MVRVQYAIVFVSDMAESIAFYRDVVGASLRFDSPEWTEFDTEGATLALHRGEPKATSGGHQDPTAAGQSHPGFRVEDLDVFHTKMIENDVAVVRNPVEEFGVRIAQYLDPDGLVFSVSELRDSA